MADEPETQAVPETRVVPADAGAVNQGATGARPMGESPLSVSSDSDPFAERPEAFVGGAFAGGLVLAVILRRLTR